MSAQTELTLTIQNGPQADQSFQLKTGSQTIGRAAKNQIVIADPTISKQHARLTVRTDEVVIEDLGSANGSFVNGRRISVATPISPGDSLRIGSNVMLAVSRAGEVGAPAEPESTYVPGAPADLPAAASGFKLIVQNGPQPGQLFTLAGGAQTIGRTAGNQIQLADPTVSKQHARLTVQPEGVYLQDLGSANGTFVNGRRLAQPTLIQPGDALQIGTWVTLGLQGPGPAGATLSARSRPTPQGNSTRGWIVAGVALLVIIGLALATLLVLQLRPTAESPTAETVAQVSPEPPTPEPSATPLPEVEVAFSADRTTVQLGECTTLRWQVEAVKEVRLDGEAVAATGSRQICPREPAKSYRLTALSLAGETVEQSLLVTVPPTPPPPPELDIQFSADQTSVPLGDCTTLRWTVENAQEVRLSGDKVGASGTELVCPTEPANSYKLVIQPLAGASVEQVVIINVPPTPTPEPTVTPLPPTATVRPQASRPVIDKFIADQYTVNQGTCTSLRWSVRNTQSVQLSGGEVGSQTVGNEGARRVCPPAASTTYDLVASGAGGSDQRSLTISLSGGQLQPGGSGVAPGSSNAVPLTLRVGNHIYEQPWGAARGGDVCQTYRDHSWDDEKPFYRGFNVELLLTNNSTIPVPDDWGENVSYVTANGKSSNFCYYGYNGAGPPPDGASSVTFFALIDQGDYVRFVQMTINGHQITVCLDGAGAQVSCQ